MDVLVILQPVTGADEEVLLRHRTSGHVGNWSAGGHLIITRDSARFVFDSAFNRMRSDLPEAITATMPLALYHARLLPPLFNAGLVVAGPQGVMTILLFWGQLYRVRPALQRTNYPVVYERTWLSIGSAAGRMPLPPPGEQIG